MDYWKSMEYLTVFLLLSIAQSIKMPLVNHLSAPLVADLDITSLNKELKEYVETNVKNEVNQTCQAKIQTAVNDSLFDLKSDIMKNFEGEFYGLQQKISVHIASLEEGFRKGGTELKQNLTVEIHQSQQRTAERFANLENSLRKEHINLKHNLTTDVNQLEEVKNMQFTSLEVTLRKEIKQLNLELRKETDQLKELKDSLITEMNQSNVDLRKENNKLKSDLEELKMFIMRSIQYKLVDCSDLIRITNKSAVYLIHPGALEGFWTYCDMETDGGGWTVFQRRINGMTDFYRGWNDYKDGFGDPQTEFWMGNSKLAMMTTQRQYELRIDLEDYSGAKAFAKYSSFSIGDESTKYTLTVDGYSGTAGDSLDWHNNMAFTTKDSDNDHGSGNCATTYKGAWWYNICHYSNLNGLYGNTGYTTGMRWYHWKNNSQSMKTTSMMIRRKRT